MQIEDIKNLIPDATEEQLNALIAAVEKELEPLNAVKEQLKTANDRITELSNDLKKYDGADDTIKSLQDKVKEYEDAEKDRIAREAEEAKERNLLSAFDAAAQGKTFINDFTRTALFEQVKAEMGKEENAGKGVAELFGNLTEGKENIFAPQITAPQMNGSTVSTTTEVDELRSLFGLK